MKVCKYANVMPFLKVKITNLWLEQVRAKKPSKLTTETQTFKEESQWRKETYISHVRLYVYW
jgi:hypothetical protein